MVQGFPHDQDHVTHKKGSRNYGKEFHSTGPTFAIHEGSRLPSKLFLALYRFRSSLKNRETSGFVSRVVEDS